MKGPSWAAIDPAGTYRYSLGRTLRTGGLKILWVMLNPSTANAVADDPTIRKVCEFSRRMGYGVVEIANLFALRSTDPKALRTHADPVGPDNDKFIGSMIQEADEIVCAWGNHGSLFDRDVYVYGKIRTIRVPLVLKLNAPDKKTGRAQPAHPLYQSYDVVPSRWHR